MLLYVNLDTQNFTEQPLVANPISSISVPRSGNVPIHVQFTRNGSIVDPEALEAAIVSGTVAANPVFTSYAHGFSAGDTIILEDVAGAAKTISSSTSASPAVFTVTAHGYANGQTVALSGHSSVADGDYVVAGVTTNTFTLGVDTTSTGAGGTVTAALPNPDINGSRVIASVTEDTFTINGLNLLSAVAGGTATRLTDLDLRWTVKETGKFDQDPAMASIIPPGFTKYGTGSSTIFKGSCTYITAELNALLGVNPPTTTDDVEQATLMAELSWDGASPSKTNWVTHYVRNDLYKTGEADPVTTGGEDGSDDIPNAASTVTVLFSTPLVSDAWHFLGTPMVVNTTDSSPLGIQVVMLTARTASGFTVALSAAVDSANYDLEWQVRPN